QHEADESTPIVADQTNPLELECVEERDDVAGELLLLIAPRGSVRPSEAAQVGADHTVPLSQSRDHLPPLPPVLPEAMHEHDRIAASRLGYMHPEAGEVHKAVLNRRELRQRSKHDAILNRSTRR